MGLTRASSARPPKLVSNPQIRCCGSIIVSSCPAGSSSSTDRQCATTSSPGDHRFPPRPAPPPAPGQVRADHVIGQVVPAGEVVLPAVALQEPEGRHRLRDRSPPRGCVYPRGPPP